MNIFKSIINNFKTIAAHANIDQLKQKYIAKQIQFDELAEQLKLLMEDKTEFDFIGITSNRYDCIYFAKNNQNFNIEFEAVEEDQIPYLEKLKDFAYKNNFQFDIKTNGKIRYLSIKINSALSETIYLAKRIQKEIFGNADDTKYDVVP